MKIAINLSGLPRCYKQGYEEIKKWFLDRYDCDVFIHTWYNTNTIYKTGHKFSPQKDYQFTEEDYRNVLDLYKPKAYTFQKPIPFDITGIKSKLDIKLNVSMSNFYSIKACYDLIQESGNHYDLVIRMRFDLRYTDHISPECIFLKDITQVNPNKLHYFQYSDDPDERASEIDDLFAVGSMEVMGVYCNVFPYILSYLYTDKDYENWLSNIVTDPAKLVNESMLKYHILKNGIELNPVSSYKQNWAPLILR